MIELVRLKPVLGPEALVDKPELSVDGTWMLAEEFGHLLYWQISLSLVNARHDPHLRWSQGRLVDRRPVLTHSPRPILF